MGRILVFNRIRLIPFAQLPAIGGYRDRQVHICWRFESKGFLQTNLPAGGVKQVSTPYHLVDRLEIIINNHRQLIGNQAICTLDDEITGDPGGRV